MRTWTRAAVPTYCGLCGVLIPAEDPALVITIVGVKKTKIRCQACEGPAPADLPELKKSAVPPLEPPLEEMTPIRKLIQEFQGTIWKRG